ncbi:MAG: hypothetical protein KDA51_10170, partial [Planctomycetales bacterium]|nr:hypothetical protein [Planctomycetales bacterium]
RFPSAFLPLSLRFAHGISIIPCAFRMESADKVAAWIPLCRRFVVQQSSINGSCSGSDKRVRGHNAATVAKLLIEEINRPLVSGVILARDNGCQQC